MSDLLKWWQEDMAPPYEKKPPKQNGVREKSKSEHRKIAALHPKQASNNPTNRWTLQEIVETIQTANQNSHRNRQVRSQIK